MATTQVEQQLGRLFDTAVDHFVITDTDSPLPAGWQLRRRSHWRLASHPRLPVHDLQDRSGSWIGWILGYAVTQQGCLVDGPVQLGPYGEGGSLDNLEDGLYRLSGRFCCLVSTPAITRLYLDPGGSLGAVYSLDRRIVAATTSLVRAIREGPEFPRPDINSFPANVANGWFPAGLTACSSVRRVMANHFLDLGTWEVRRHWPRNSIERLSEAETPLAVRKIVSTVQRGIEAVAARHDFYIALSGGYDSRMVLGCARAAASRCSLFTFDVPTSSPSRAEGEADVGAAKALARIAGLPHQVVKTRRSTEEEKQRFLFLAGHDAGWGKSVDFRVGAGEALQPERGLLTGFYGELGRGSYWRFFPDGRSALTPERVLEHRQLPTTEPFDRALTAWFEGLGNVEEGLLMDLLQLEFYYAGWLPPRMYGFAPFRLIGQPLCSRDCLESMLALPLQYRLENRLPQDILSCTWPELLEVPWTEALVSASHPG